MSCTEVSDAHFSVHPLVAQGINPSFETLVWESMKPLTFKSSHYFYKLHLDNSMISIFQQFQGIIFSECCVGLMRHKNDSSCDRPWSVPLAVQLMPVVGMVLTASESHFSKHLKHAYFLVSKLETSLKATSITDSCFHRKKSYQTRKQFAHRKSCLLSIISLHMFLLTCYFIKGPEKYLLYVSSPNYH